MTLSIDQLRRGNRVCICFDDDGNPLPVKRYGVISKVETVVTWKDEGGQRVPDRTMANGNPRNGVSKIWVSIKEGEPPVEVKNAWLGLVREGRRGDWVKLKAEDDAERVADLEAKRAVPKKGENYEVDETGVEHKGPVNEKELERLTGSEA